MGEEGRKGREGERERRRVRGREGGGEKEGEGGIGGNEKGVAAMLAMLVYVHVHLHASAHTHTHTHTHLQHGFLKHPQLQHLLKVDLFLLPQVLHLHLPLADVVQQAADDRHSIDLIWCHI